MAESNRTELHQQKNTIIIPKIPNYLHKKCTQQDPNQGHWQSNCNIEQQYCVDNLSQLDKQSIWKQHSLSSYLTHNQANKLSQKSQQIMSNAEQCAKFLQYVLAFKRGLKNEVRHLWLIKNQERQKLNNNHKNTSQVISISQSVVIDIQILRQKIQSSVDEHYQYYCNQCGVQPIKGYRYHCYTCINYDICERCYNLINHEHILQGVTTSNSKVKQMLRLSKQIQNSRSITKSCDINELHSSILRLKQQRELIKSYNHYLK